MSSFFYQLRYWLTDYRVVAALGVLMVGAVALGRDKLTAIGGWLLLAVLAALALWLVVWLVKRARARRAGDQIEAMVQQQADRAVASASTQGNQAARADAEVLRGRMSDAVKAIRSSKLGQLKGSAALYELPWYVIIGNPAAGKSTAILNSGLRFPFEDNRSNVIHGLGGTRNCDWYFTTEGIVLDTAGRYTVSNEDRLEWLTFLDLLKKNRPRAPINGIIIAASIAELSGSKPEFAIDLAKNLRQRVQELTERLEVFAPVYVVFTKADLIAGFSDFFRSLDPSERENVWGATLPYVVDAQGDPAATDALAAFDGHFDQLADGLKESSLAQMALQRGREVAPALLTLPMEFAGIKPALRTFIATLFEENPYQFKPVFRGFYFTSALQEGMSVQPASERVARQFALAPRAAGGERVAATESSHFLLNLFRKVIFADKQLVRQYSSRSRNKLRVGAFAAAVLVLALALTGWTWSYTSNKQLVANVSADLDKAVALQKDRVDLQSRVEALLLLQDWMQRLERQRRDNPISMGLGLYQGARIETKLRAEYFGGMRQLMLTPVNAKLESYLHDVVAQRNALKTVALAGAAADGVDATAQAGQGQGLYQEPSPTDAEDAYNALKTYLMLGDRGRVETSHLNDQLTRFWRSWLEANRGAMPRETMVAAAERLMHFYVEQSAQPGWPQIDPKIALVDDSRQALKLVMKGTPALDRVYAQIKARAATRFAPITVATLLDGAQGAGPAAQGAVAGSYQVSGTFSRAAWDEYVRDAIKAAANEQLSSNDWVLDATVQSDLTLAGSPEHISKELVALYKADYAREWRKFLQGVTVAEFGNFERAVAVMNSLGDPSGSPLRKLLEAVNRETIWDNPGAENKALGAARQGFMAWFERVIMRRNPTGVAVTLNPDTGKPMSVAIGPIGKEFEGLARLLAVRDGSAPLLEGYFIALGKLRTRLNAIKSQGDPGPGARKLMQETLDGSGGDGDGSELAQAQRLVDEQMLNGLNETQRDALRPLLMRPLVQTFAALVRPAEGEINRTWSAQVLEPFRSGIGQKYPYAAGATVEAAPADIAAIFGPDGAIAKFTTDALGALVIRRGNTMTPQRWADMGINLRPELMTGYAGWVAPLGQAGGGAAGANTTIFEVLPLPAAGTISEYTLTIDGQQLRYRNTPPQWTTFTWPNPQGTPGVRVSAVAADGRSIDVLNVPGQQGLARLFDAAQRVTKGNDHYQLTWSSGDATVSVELRIISATQASAAQSTGARGVVLPDAVAGAAPVLPTPAAPGAVAASATAASAPAGAP